MATLTYTQGPFFMQVNRPMSMKKDGIQTRKRKPRTSSAKKSIKEPAHSNHVTQQAHSLNTAHSPTGLLDLSQQRTDSPLATSGNYNHAICKHNGIQIIEYIQLCLNGEHPVGRTYHVWC